MRVRIEENFLKQVIILVQYSFRNTHMPFESRARRILVLHHGSEDKGRDKRNAKRVSHRPVVFLKAVFVDVQVQPLIEVLEEYPSHVITLADDDCILFAQLVEIGKGRTEHRMRRHIGVSALTVPVFQSRLHRTDIRQDTVFRQYRQHFFKGRYRIFHRHRIDYKFRLEALHFIQCRKSLTVICKTKAACIFLVRSYFVVETKQVDEETSHLSCAHYQYFHILLLVSDKTLTA